MTATLQSPTKTNKHNASIEADPFLLDMPEKDYVKISLDETPLPMPDELPPECPYDDFECIETRSALIEQRGAQKASPALAKTQTPDRGSAMAGTADPDKPPIPVLVQKQKPKQGPGRAGQSYSSGRALRDACFQSVMFFPRKILLIGHWAHDLKLGMMSGRKVIVILSVVCFILLVILMFAALWRSNSMRGIL